MDLTLFRNSLADANPPGGLPPPLQALWHAAKNNSDGAHALVQDETTADAAWVHAYLHRVEGDLGNAGYWYQRAGKPVAKAALDDEWQEIAATLLAS